MTANFPVSAGHLNCIVTRAKGGTPSRRSGVAVVIAPGQDSASTDIRMLLAM